MNAQRTGRRNWMLIAGVGALVGLLGAAIALLLGADARHSDNVANLARAPVGCDTTLDFEATGAFVVYVETTGEFDQLAGECDADRRYDRDRDDVPELDLTLIDPNGDALEFGDVEPEAYDVDGFVGTAVRSVQIETAGDHVLTVTPISGEQFAVAVGRAVDQGVAPLRWGAGVAAIVGLVLGGWLLVLGSRRASTPAAPDAPWTPAGQAWPASPPGFPVPPPTTGATGPAGPPFAAPSPPQAADADPQTPGNAGSDGEQRSPWAPPSSPAPPSSG